MSSSSISSPLGEPIWRELIGKQCKRLLRIFAAVNDRVPAALFNRATQMVLDSGAAGLAFFLAFQLRFDGSVPPRYQVMMWAWVLAVTILRPLALLALGAYDSIWRYFNLRDVLALTISALAPSLLLLIMRLGFAARVPLMGIPVSVVLTDLGLFVLLAGTLRALRRASFEQSRSAKRSRAVLLGTGDALAAAVRQVSLHPAIDIVGLLSPDEKLHGLRIAGFTVMELAALPMLLVRESINTVFIAEAKLDCLADTVQTATEFGVEVRLMPSVGNIVRGDVRVSAHVDPEQALSGRGRLPEKPHPAVVDSMVGKDILITGAGGSIGSEISRQVSRLEVGRAILLDRDENAIFELQNQLAELGPRTEVVPVVGDIRDRNQLRHVFARYRPHVVLHAAAYKHVPVMEQNPCEAVLNNVTGTRQLLELAIEAKAERFLMISTDKAVKPTSVMGATKRVAELLVRARSPHGNPLSRGHSTLTACVRFGNVLGSRGSVVPIFRRQIAAGGPITITHEEMTRYFITIPEAVQLVMQAATLASHGTIYMLDMGDPVKITHLAHRLIEMSGLRPNKDIQIEIVGTRPGEKLHEQLWYEDCAVTSTSFEGVLAVEGQPVPMGFEPAVKDLEQTALARRDDEVLRLLRDLPIDFRVEKSQAMIA